MVEAQKERHKITPLLDSIWKITKEYRENFTPIDRIPVLINDKEVPRTTVRKAFKYHLTSEEYDSYTDQSRKLFREKKRRVSTKEFGPKVMEAITSDRLPKSMIEENLGLKEHEFKKIFIEFNSTKKENGEIDLNTGRMVYKNFMKTTNEINILYQTHKNIIPQIEEILNSDKKIVVRDICDKYSFDELVFYKIVENFIHISKPLTNKQKRQYYLPAIIDLKRKGVSISAMIKEYKIPLNWKTIKSIIDSSLSPKIYYRISTTGKEYVPDVEIKTTTSKGKKANPKKEVETKSVSLPNIKDFVLQSEYVELEPDDERAKKQAEFFAKIEARRKLSSKTKCTKSRYNNRHDGKNKE